MKRRLAVGALAEFVHRRGDLYARLDGRTGADEGIKVQRKLQRAAPESYQRERAVSLVRDIAGVSCTISGRIDGCDVQARLLEEYKTTRADAQAAHAHHASAHWAQIQLYGALLVAELPPDAAADAAGSWTLRLIYCHPDSLQTSIFERTFTSTMLTRFLEDTIIWLDAWMQTQRAHERSRDRALAGLEFPHSEYRPHQHALARRAYRALRNREHLLLEAPTGSGKTIGLLYPAVKALGSTDHDKIFYLTSRNTGARAAMSACAQLDPDRRYLRYVQLISKEQACLVEGMPCDPQRCEYADGYYDRVHDAVSELLTHRAIGPEQVRTIAQAHRVCPFELTLDAALWADVLIGDYNYVFDPVVRLQRFAADPSIALLVDESHQLSARARDMLALTLSRSVVRDALRDPLPAALQRRARAIDRNLATLARGEPTSGDRVLEKPDALLRAIVRFVDELAGTDISLLEVPRTRELVHQCFRWARADAWYDEKRCVFIGNRTDREFTVKRLHLDPGPYLQSVFNGFGGHIRFSGTVSPLPLYQRLHGVDSGPAERAGSPFAPEQLEVLIVDDVPTYWRSRARSLDRLVALIATVVAARAGNYLVALPSFEYLRAVAAALDQQCPQLEMVVQQRTMNAEERAEFVGRLQTEACCKVGLIVLGGVFAESVDYSMVAGPGLQGRGSTITGVICVGVGLPPPDLERKRLEAHFDAQGDDGHAIAFQQPAMTKILQMAGRLLRDPVDRGVLCLVDARFKDAAYQRFFPSHWQPRVVGADAIAERLDKFWRGVAGSPRLRAAIHQGPSRTKELNK